MSEDNSQQNLHNTLWESYYQAIYRCNELIQHEQVTSWTDDEANHGQYIGEARAMRVAYSISTSLASLRIFPWSQCLLQPTCLRHRSTLSTHRYSTT